MSECNFKKASEAIGKCIEELMKVDCDLSKLIIGADTPYKARSIATFVNKCAAVYGMANRKDDKEMNINNIAS